MHGFACWYPWHMFSKCQSLNSDSSRQALHPGPFHQFFIGNVVMPCQSHVSDAMTMEHIPCVNCGLLCWHHNRCMQIEPDRITVDTAGQYWAQVFHQSSTVRANVYDHHIASDQSCRYWLCHCSCDKKQHHLISHSAMCTLILHCRHTISFYHKRKNGVSTAVTS